jgi:ubiquinone/menaquinone biosynthesis C-methylase UbiE
MTSDRDFNGSLPDLYDRHLGPLFFAPYAADIAGRAAATGAANVLELAAGTGIATEALAATLPGVRIEATDLNEAMVSLAASRRPLPMVRWSVADAMEVPFPDGTFDLVVCQFGVMFFPDFVHAFREARRVLNSNGTFLFNVWDGIEHNEAARIVSAAAGSLFPGDPPRLLQRKPYGYGDPSPIEDNLREAGFSDVSYDVVTKRSYAPSARHAAIGVCEGTPLRHEINARDPERMREVVETATRELERALGDGAIDAAMRAYVYAAR